MKNCWFYKILFGLAWPPGTALPPFLQAHLKECPGCLASRQRHEHIAQTLATSTEKTRIPAPPFLHNKIMAAIEANGNPRGSTLKSWHVSWALAMASAILAVLGGVFWLAHRTNFRNDAAQMAEATNMIRVARSFIATNKLANGSTLVSWSESLEKPLETELQSVVYDARTAVNGLAQNFLPEKMRLALFSTRPN